MTLSATEERVKRPRPRQRAAVEVRCPQCGRVLAKRQAVDVAHVRYRKRVNVRVRDGEVECPDCEIWVAL